MYFVNKNDVSEKIGLRRLQLAYPNTNFPELVTDEDLVDTDYLILDEKSGMGGIELQSWQTVMAKDMIAEGKATTVYTVIDSDIDTLKAIKKGEVNNWRPQQVNLGFEYGGYRWDGDLTSVMNLTTCFISGSAPISGYWTSFDNIDVPVDFDYISGMYTAMIQNGQHVHAVQRDMKNAIDVLQTSQEVMEFDVYNYIR